MTELKTAKFSRGEKKVYLEVLKLFEAMMVEIKGLDSGDEAIRVFALFLQDLDMLGSTRRQYGHVYRSCFYTYARGLVDLPSSTWHRGPERKRRGLNP